MWKKCLEAVSYMQKAIELIETEKCTCNEYTGHTCARCLLIMNLKNSAINMSEALYKSLKEND